MCRTHHIDVIINCESVILIFFFSFYSKKENTALGIAESIFIQSHQHIEDKKGEGYCRNTICRNQHRTLMLPVFFFFLQCLKHQLKAIKRNIFVSAHWCCWRYSSSPMFCLSDCNQSISLMKQTVFLVCRCAAFPLFFRLCRSTVLMKSKIPIIINGRCACCFSSGPPLFSSF